MSNTFLESREAIQRAREALRRGDLATARRLGEKAAQLAPGSEDPWLILAAVASPSASLDYIRKALDANPESARARRAMQWAMQRLQQAPEPAAPKKPVPAAIAGTVTSQTKAQARPEPGRKKGNIVFPVLLLALGCVIVLFAAWSALSNPALAAILSLSAPTQPPPTAHPQSWAQAELPKPGYMATIPAPTLLPTATETPRPTDAPPLAPTTISESTATPEVVASPEIMTTPEVITTTEVVTATDPTATPETASLSEGMQAVIVEDTPTSEYSAPASEPGPAVSPGSIAAAVYGERWIDVDLSQQRVYAYEGDTMMNAFIVSTGTWQTPTVTGTYKIWIKLRSTTMTGPGYYLPNVPYTMYFYKGYGLHGTYWHHNFGVPMSHGCVNLSISDAEWLYNFASVGTTVNVHY